MNYIVNKLNQTKMYLVCICLLTCINHNGFAQLDDTFWFAAPEATNSHGDRPIFLRMSSFGASSDVRISQPANPAFSPINITIGASATQSVELTDWIDLIENFIPNAVASKGILIESTNPITAYYEVKGRDFNPDIFTLKGLNALGEEFYIPSQNFYDNGNYTIPARNGFDIVATEDGTVVTITPSSDIFGHAAGSTFTISLNKGETYSAIAISTLASNHLNGSYVTSNKPIAITVKDDSVWNAQCKDMLGDQIVPTEIVGNEYIVMRGALLDPDRIFVTAIEDNTTIEVNNTVVATINTAETFQYDVFDSSIYVVTSQPVYLWHVSGFGCELGAALLPPIVCTGSFETAFIRASDLSNTIFGINLLVENGGQSDFTLNGSSTTISASNFSPVPGTGNTWHFAQIVLNDITVGQPNLLTNSTSRFHLGVIDGGATSGTRYGYFSNFGKFVNVDITSNSPICLGEELTLSAEAISEADYLWSGPDGFASTEQSITIDNVDNANAGTYTLAVSLEDCESDPIDVDVEINELPEIEATAMPSVLDIIEEVQLEANGNINNDYQWEPSDLVSDPTIQNPVTNIFETTIFYVETIDSNGCSNIDSIIVRVTEEICKEPNIFVPNAFSPNGDALNDIFRVRGVVVKSAHLIIYDQWGNRLFESTNLDEGWDGETDKAALFGDVYAYSLMVECFGGYTYYKKGNITLLK